MTKKHRLGAAIVAAMGAVASLALPAAQASTPTCATSATITSRQGTGWVDLYTQAHPNGVRYDGRELTRSTNNSTSHFYELHDETITATFGTDTFTIGNNAVFSLVCSGVSKSQGAVMPAIQLFIGMVTVRTTSRVLGSVVTQEALIGPVTSNPAMTYTVTRRLTQKQPPTAQQKMIGAFGFSNQLPGTTTTRTLADHKLVNVTPYVGARQGSCRHVRAARLTSTSWAHGTATYTP